MGDALFRKKFDTPEEINGRYTLIKRVGKGSYGVVYEALDTETNDKVAIKCIEGVFNTTVDAKRTLRELSILRQCSHQNIVECRMCLRPPNPKNFSDLWIVLNMCKWDLGKVMRLSKSFKGWGDQHVKFILHQTLCGMNYLHSANIVHRDLKPSNLLVTERCEIRICDFGLSREIARAVPRTRSESVSEAPSGGAAPLQSVLTKHVVTRWYRAPELILLAARYTPKIDVWSMGCIFAELLQTLEPVSDDAVPPTRTLFPGESCYPLSSTSNEEEVDAELFNEELQAETHQLNKIFDHIGTPDAEDVGCIESVVLKKILGDWVAKYPIAKKGFGGKYASAAADALALLESMLLFNPDKRASLPDTLSSEYLKDSAQTPLVPIDMEAAMKGHGVHMRFDWEYDPSFHTQDKLRTLLMEEQEKYARGEKGPEGGAAGGGA